MNEPEVRTAMALERIADSLERIADALQYDDANSISDVIGTVFHADLEDPFIRTEAFTYSVE